jgi:nucleoside-diphosphate-sugar epimerase
VAVLRPTIVFGAGMPNRSIAQMIAVIQRGLFFFVGRRGASANYVHVANVVDALVLCGTSPSASGRTYNLSDWTTVEDFARVIADALGRPRPRLRLPERPVRLMVGACGRITTLPLTQTRIDALVTRARYASERIQQELGYVPRVSIAAGLAELVAHEAGR